MRFDQIKAELTWGNIANAALMLLGMASLWFGLVSRVETLETAAVRQDRQQDVVTQKLDRLSTGQDEARRAITGLERDIQWLIRAIRTGPDR